MKILLMCFLIVVPLLMAACGGGGGGGSSEKEKPVVDVVETPVIEPAPEPVPEPVEKIIVEVIKTEPPKCRSGIYGDSITKQLMDSVYAPGFTYFATPGLMITEQEPLDSSFCTIYLALGTNIDWDAGKETEELKLLSLIAGIEDKVICVLPMAQGGVFYHMRDMMTEHCQRIIDPAQQGIIPGAGDGTHLLWGGETQDNYNLEEYAALFPAF